MTGERGSEFSLITGGGSKSTSMDRVAACGCEPGWKGPRTSFNGGVQFPQAGSDFGIHLTLPLRLLGEGVAIGTKRLADLHSGK